MATLSFSRIMFLLSHLLSPFDSYTGFPFPIPHPPPTGGNIRTSSPSFSTVAIPLRNAMSCPLIINRICERGEVVLGSNNWDLNPSPQVSTIVTRSSCRVLFSGTDISTSLFPRILFRSNMVRILSVINAIPFCLTGWQLHFRKSVTFMSRKKGTDSHKRSL